MTAGTQRQGMTWTARFAWGLLLLLLVRRRGKPAWIEDAWFGLMRQAAWFAGARAGLWRGSRTFR